MPEQPERRLTRDAEVLKVFTHPLRIRLGRLLHSEGPSTASELARLVDATPSLVSYHLRTMAKYGYVVEDPAGSADGRERRWRHANDLTFSHADFADDPAALDTADAVARVLRAEISARHEAALRRLRTMSRAWQDANFSAGPSLRLTAAETEELFTELLAVVDRYQDRAPQTESGEQRERVQLELLGFPYEP
jgi:predicted transcriptional regulator